MEERRITQKDVARALAIDVSTVSKALKGDPKVARKTRARVVETANRIGYRPDPVLSALVRYRREHAPVTYRGTIAWMYDHPVSTAMDRFAGYRLYLKGARNRAEQLGYKVEEFRIGEDRMTVERMTGVLRARGISALVISPLQDARGTINLAWNLFAAVAIGYTLREPSLDLVTNDHYETMTRLVEALRGCGRRRIGVYAWSEDHNRVQERAVAALSAWTALRQVPVMIYQESDREAFVKWFRTHHLDAVITRATEVEEWLRDAGRSVPADVLLASYAWEAAGVAANWPGMDHNNAEIGAAAVEWVIRKVEQGETGVPACPRRLLVTSTWRPGNAQLLRSGADLR